MGGQLGQGGAGGGGGGALVGLTWEYDTATADGDPGSGKFRANNATPSGATELYIDPLSAAGVSLNTLLGVQRTPGFLYLEQQDDPTRWALFDVTAITAAGAGYQKLQVVINGVPPSAEIQGGKAISFAFLVGPHPELHSIASHDDTTATGVELETLTNGSNADALHIHAGGGGALAGETWEFDSATGDADPGAGKFRFNAVQAAATLLYLDNLADSGAQTGSLSISRLVVGDHLYIEQQSDATKRERFVVTGPIVIASGYIKVPIQVTEGTGGFIATTENCTIRIFKAANVTQTGTPVDNFITGATGADNGAGVGASGDEVGQLGGDGGDGTTGGGNAGGTLQTGGDGGDSSVSGNGGGGGLNGLAGGKGGAANGASGDGGEGGAISFLGGAGGSSAGGTEGNGGSVEVDAGSGNVNGAVSIGINNAREFVSGTGSSKHKHQGGQYTPTNDLGSVPAAVTPNLALSNVFKTTLTGNATLTFTNLSDGQAGYLHVTQDGTGSRTLVSGAGVLMPGGVIALSGGIGATDTLAFVVDGANVRVWVEALAFA